MKTIKKVISSIVAVIMLITDYPVLQAGDIVLNVDRTQIAELQKEILQDVKVDLNKSKDPVKDLMDRYKQAKLNTEAEIKKKAQEAWNEYVNKLKDKNTRNQVVLSTILFMMIEYEAKYRKVSSFIWKEPVCVLGISEVGSTSVMNTTSSMLESALKGHRIGGKLSFDVMDLFDFNNTAGCIKTGSTIALLATVVMKLPMGYTPVIHPSLNENETTRMFSEQPFEFLNQFEQQRFEYENLYKKCPELLRDSVDIEFYVSLNPSLENMRAKLFTTTSDWKTLSIEERKAYLKDLSERLRAEAKAGTKQQFNNLRIGLEAK